MVLEITHSESSNSEVRDILADALKNETLQAKLRLEHFSNLCTKLETEHKLSSDEFLTQFENGDLGDDEVYFDWYAAKRGYDIWSRRTLILSSIQL